VILGDVNNSLLVHLVVDGIYFGTPLLFAALGELLAERSGVLNLGIEGMMLMGAVSGFWVSQQLDWPAWAALIVAVLAAGAVGALMALIHAFMTVTLGTNQIVSGLALTIMCGAFGLSAYLGQVGSSSTSAAPLHQFNAIDVFGGKDVPVVGPIFLHQNALVYVSWALVILVALYLYRTRFGLHLRAVGEEPYSADAMGINVARYRYVHVLAGGAFAGIAGSCYTLAIAPGWSSGPVGVTGGAGWIALALVIFAFWRPGFVLVGAYLFGLVTSLGNNLQTRGVALAPEIFNGLPYAMAIIALVLVSSTWARHHFGAPKALGIPYSREGD
jgi:ABC-type uncharacterized transport system permease subunit